MPWLYADEAGFCYRLPALRLHGRHAGIQKRPAVFTILQGKYLVGAPLGKGGFGITYIAMDLQTETVVAIKEYFPADFACRAADTETVLPVDEKQSLYFAQA